MEQFHHDVKKWVEYDNEIKILNSKIKTLREARVEHEKSVIKYVEKNKMENSVVKISDGLLKFSNVLVSQNLTYKYLQTCLLDLFSHEEVNRLIAHIKNKRGVNNHLDIKRYSSK